MSMNYPNSYDGPVQVIETRTQIVALTAGLGDGTNAPAIVRIRNPGGPNRFKLSLAFVPKDSSVVPGGGISNGSTIWVHADDDMDNAGGSRGPFPVTDLDGTSALPTAIPQSSGLLGYSREFVTSADYVTGTLRIFDTPTGCPGTWYAKAAMFPAFAYYTSQQAWETLRAMFQLDVILRATV